MWTSIESILKLLKLAIPNGYPLVNVHQTQWAGRDVTLPGGRTQGCDALHLHGLEDLCFLAGTLELNESQLGEVVVATLGFGA